MSDPFSSVSGRSRYVLFMMQTEIQGPSLVMKEHLKSLPQCESIPLIKARHMDKPKSSISGFE